MYGNILNKKEHARIVPGWPQSSFMFGYLKDALNKQ